MRRRDLIIGAAGVLTASVTAPAQSGGMPLVGFLSGRTRAGDAPYLPETLRGFREAGFVDGRTMVLDQRWVEGAYSQAPAIAADMVGRGAAVLLVVGTAAARAVERTIATTPIVFGTADDPVAAGLVDSIGRPSGNVTGVTMNSAELRPKMLSLLHEIVPLAKTVYMLANPKNVGIALQTRDTATAAAELGLRTQLLQASTAADIDAAFATVPGEDGLALLVASDPFLTDRHEQIVALSARHRLPAIYPWREYAVSGGLISYGASIGDTYYQAAGYAARILKGAKTSDLPVMQPSRFELVINLKTAKALGLTVPPLVLARADEVIE